MFKIANNFLKQNWLISAIYFALTLCIISVDHFFPNPIISFVLSLMALFLFTNWATIAADEIKGNCINTKIKIRLLFCKNERYLRIIILFAFIAAIISIITLPLVIMSIASSFALGRVLQGNPIFLIFLFLIALIISMYMHVTILVSVNKLIYHNKEVFESFTESAKQIVSHLYLIPFIIGFSVVGIVISIMQTRMKFASIQFLIPFCYSYISLIIMSKFKIKTEIEDQIVTEELTCQTRRFT